VVAGLSLEAVDRDASGGHIPSSAGGGRRRLALAGRTAAGQP